MLSGRNMRMILYCSVNFLNSSVLCTDALSHTSSIHLAVKGSGPVHDVCCFSHHGANTVSVYMTNPPVMPAAGGRCDRLAFG